MTNGFVYFICNPADGLIKIGATGHHPDRRLRSLSAEAGVVLVPLGFIPGGNHEERMMHRRFAILRRRGEWFDPGDRLLYFIRRWARPWSEAREPDPEAIRAAEAARDAWVREEATRRGWQIGDLRLDRRMPPGSPRLLVNVPKPRVA
jgi:hypothetical protein